MAEKKKNAEAAVKKPDNGKGKKSQADDKEKDKAKKDEAGQEEELEEVAAEPAEDSYDGVPFEQLPRRLRWKIKAKQFLKKVAAVLLVISTVGIVGFFLGAYLQIADLNLINEKYHVYEWPVVGQYFVKLPWERYAEYRAQKEEEERIAAEQEAARQANEASAKSDAAKAQTEADKIAAETAKAKAEADAAKKASEGKSDAPEAIPAVQPPPEANQSPDIVITPEQIQKERKQREAAEKKRVTKLARLYNDMKPDDTAKIIDNLDDDLAVAILQRMDEGQSSKVLAKLDPAKAARYSSIIYSGRRTSLTSI